MPQATAEVTAKTVASCSRSVARDSEECRGCICGVLRWSSLLSRSKEAAAAADIEQSIRWRERVEDRAAREVVYNDAPRRAGHRRAGSRCESS
jgi:hypothetical protein